MNVRFKAIFKIMIFVLITKVDILQGYIVTIDLLKQPNGTIISSEIFNRCSHIDSVFYYFKGSGIIIFLEIIYLNMPKSYSERPCIHRRIEIRQGWNSTIVYCGKMISKSLIAAFNQLEVVYINDGGDISNCQYSMRYYSVKAVSCGINIFRQNQSYSENRKSIFSTPYYPYPGLAPKTECDIRFSARPKYRVAVKFIDIDLVSSENCRVDHVNIFSIIAGHRYSLIARLCDQKSTGEWFFSDQTELYIQIKALSNKTRRGVQFAAKYVHENDISSYLSNSEVCGKSFFNQTSGIIKLRNLNRLHQITCAWHIQAALGWKVQLRIANLYLGKSTKCSSKYLVIYNSPPRSDLLPMDRLCGIILPKNAQNVVILSEKSHMFLRLIKLPKTHFTVDEYIHLEYSIVNTDLRNDSCPGFHCSGGRVCTDPQKLLCYSISRYCIPWELRCDYKHSCANYDYSDEESCLLTNIRNNYPKIILEISLVLIVSLSVLFAICTVKQKLSQIPRHFNLGNQSGEINENQFSLINIQPKYLVENKDSINTIYCNPHPLPDINYPTTSFYLYFNNDCSRVTFVNHNTDY